MATISNSDVKKNSIKGNSSKELTRWWRTWCIVAVAHAYGASKIGTCLGRKRASPARSRSSSRPRGSGPSAASSPSPLSRNALLLALGAKLNSIKTGLAVLPNPRRIIYTYIHTHTDVQIFSLKETGLRENNGFQRDSEIYFHVVMRIWKMESDDAILHAFSFYELKCFRKLYVNRELRGRAIGSN